jgi:hypothetical protein
MKKHLPEDRQSFVDVQFLSGYFIPAWGQVSSFVFCYSSLVHAEMSLTARVLTAHQSAQKPRCCCWKPNKCWPEGIF